MPAARWACPANERTVENGFGGGNRAGGSEGGRARIDAWRSIVYSRTDAPWPVADREVVVENEVNFIDPPSKLKVTFRAVVAPDVQHRRGTVRMKTATGFYAIEAIDDSRSRVHYEVDADPGGTLPDWLVSMQSTRNPFETLAGLLRRLVETRGPYDVQIASFPP